MRFAAWVLVDHEKPDSLACRYGGWTLAAFCKVEPLDGSALFIIVPGFDHDKGKRMSGIEIACVEVESVLKSLAAAARHMSIQAPFRG